MSDAFIRVELYRLAEGEVREVIGHCSGVVEDKLGLSDLTPVGPVVAEIESPVYSARSGSDEDHVLQTPHHLTQ